MQKIAALTKIHFWTTVAAFQKCEELYTGAFLHMRPRKNTDHEGPKSNANQIPDYSHAVGE